MSRPAETGSQSRGKLGVSMSRPDRNRRRPSLGKLGVSESRHDRNRRRPSLGKLGVSKSRPGAQAWGNLRFPCRATTEAGGAQACGDSRFSMSRPSLGSLGFPCRALDGTTVSAFYGTRETRGTWGFHDDANQLASLGNLGCFETAAQVWGTRCFHVAAHPESPESLWNFIFPCRGATKSRQSPGNSGCLFRGAMKTATQVSGHTLGFHFASQQKFLPKSGKRGVRTCGSVSPRRCEVRTLRPKCGKGHKYNAH
jgi:hypothetical protein